MGVSAQIGRAIGRGDVNLLIAKGKKESRKRRACRGARNRSECVRACAGVSVCVCVCVSGCGCGRVCARVCECV